ncbi:EAL domain-containing protein [Alteromonas sp. CYL-A6]|uniref:EAL domain-containing protein n=1 Tax=Alteromonas nitratireducens TaxID=3390813 RepID=UPI0034B727FE
MAISEENDQGPPIHIREFERIDALRKTRLLDSSPSQRFDLITQLASCIFEVPIALVSLVDTNRQWFLSRCGLSASQTPRRDAFCAYAIHHNDIFIVEDAKAHPLFKDNPLVTGEPLIRFYAGVVIKGHDDLPLGTLCIIDTTPRSLTDNQREVLKGLAKLVENEVMLPNEISSDRIKRQLLSNRDIVTNALVGEHFLNQVELTRKQHSEPHTAHLLFLIKVTDSDTISDMYGSSVSDELFLELASRINQYTSDIGFVTVGRLEVNKIQLSVIPDRQNTSAAQVLERLKFCLTRPFETSTATIFPTIKLVALESTTNKPIRDKFCLMHTYAKSMGSHEGVVAKIISQKDKSRIRQHLRLTRELSSAIHNNELHLVYQPKIEAKTGTFSGMEALLRWEHKTEGFVSPPEIIAMAEESNLLYELEKWVFKHACLQIAKWTSEGFSVPRVSVNLTGSSLLQPDFAQFIKKVIQQYDLPKNALDIEIVESSEFEDFINVAKVMNQINRMGISFSLDDFGTGFSSLSYLKNLPFSNMKIDKRFVDKIIESQTDAKLCHSVISLAKSLDLDVIAEGIEYESQAMVLKAIGCDSFQGYHFYKPMSQVDMTNNVLQMTFEHATSLPH